MQRRDWLAATLALTSSAWALYPRAATMIEPRPVGGFHTLVWQAGGELLIEQTGQERLTIEAEPSVLSRIVTEVKGGRLLIGVKPGRLESREPLRFRLDVKTLTTIESNGSGLARIGALSAGNLLLKLAGSDDLRIARLTARMLDVQLLGAGEVAVDAGSVERQRVLIAGAANYAAPKLDCREADAHITGSGRIELAVRDQLVARIAGSGDVVYHGQPRVTQEITGAGEVRRAPA